MAFDKGMLKGTARSLSLAGLGVLLVVGLAGAFFLARAFKELPDVSTLKDFKHAISTEVYSDDGVKIGEFTKQRRYPVSFEKIPRHVVSAFIAAEDSHFYEHRGIDPGGILRAVLSNLMRGKYAQGGSTITQQVARSIVLNSREKNITRKLREIVLAWRMEKELSKNEILALYLSEIYLGHGAFGIGAAARNYFNKSVEELTVAEAAILAGLPQRPNDWDPFHNPHLAKRRQQYVLHRMAADGYITAQQELASFGEPLKVYEFEEPNNRVAPFFVEHIRLYLMNKYGTDSILNSGYKIYTTLNYEFQKAANDSLIRGLREADKRLGWRGPVTHFDSPIDIEAYQKKTHEDVMKKATTVRLLPAVGAAEGEKVALQWDMSQFQKADSKYFGQTPILENDFYRAVVTAVDDTRNEAGARIGQTNVVLPLASMAWVLVKEEPVKLMSQVLKAGDVIEVRIDKIDRKANTVTASLEQYPEIQGALLSFDLKTGAVRAMVGGKNFEESKFNCALQAKRQVGSTFKPILYAAAMDKGFSQASLVTDSPIVFKVEGGQELDTDNFGEDWRPHNYAGKFKGEIPLRLALTRSMNIPTVKLLDQISVDYGIEYSRRMGITAPLPRDLSIALGSWSSSLDEVTRAYSVFPRLGKPIGLYYLKKVVDENGHVLEEFKTTDGLPQNMPAAVAAAGESPSPTATASPVAAEGLPAGTVIAPDTAYVIVDMLQGVVKEGTGRRAGSIGGAVAGKTGTSNDHRDAWFVGFTPHIMTGVWVGYEKDKPLASGETGGRAATPIWAEYMQKVVGHYPKASFPVPEGISFAYIDPETGRLATAGRTPRVRAAFKVGSVPTRDGTNQMRIGEPGSRARLSTIDPNASPDPNVNTAKDSETGDFLRQGYQE